MFRGVVGWLAGRLRGRSEPDEESDDDSRFAPSVLDASVRYVHGGADSDVERELAAVQREADRVEDNRNR